MLQGERDKLLTTRLEKLEDGVTLIDKKVTDLDSKVNHVIQMNSELMMQTQQNFRDMRNQLDDHRVELKQSIKHLKSRFTSKCQFASILIGLLLWTILMIWFMWSP